MVDEQQIPDLLDLRAWACVNWYGRPLVSPFVVDETISDDRQACSEAMFLTRGWNKRRVGSVAVTW